LKQRYCIAPEDTAYPTVAIGAVFITAVIEAMENCEDAVVDVSWCIFTWILRFMSDSQGKLLSC
jgi:hypothetical protein